MFASLKKTLHHRASCLFSFRTSTSSFCSTPPPPSSIAHHLLRRSGISLSTGNAAQRACGSSGRMADNALLTGYEHNKTDSMTCNDVTPINIAVRRENFDTQNDPKFAVSQDTDNFPHEAVGSQPGRTHWPEDLACLAFTLSTSQVNMVNESYSLSQMNAFHQYLPHKFNMFFLSSQFDVVHVHRQGYFFGPFINGHSQHVWWMCEINLFMRLSQALVHFVMDRASLFTDHRISGLPTRAMCKHFRTMWEHTFDNSPTDFNSSSLQWWSSMHGVDTL